MKKYFCLVHQALSTFIIPPIKTDIDINHFKFVIEAIPKKINNFSPKNNVARNIINDKNIEIIVERITSKTASIFFGAITIAISYLALAKGINIAENEANTREIPKLSAP